MASGSVTQTIAGAVCPTLHRSFITHLKQREYEGTRHLVTPWMGGVEGSNGAPEKYRAKYRAKQMAEFVVQMREEKEKELLTADRMSMVSPVTRAGGSVTSGGRLSISDWKERRLLSQGPHSVLVWIIRS